MNACRSRRSPSTWSCGSCGGTPTRRSCGLRYVSSPHRHTVPPKLVAMLSLHDGTVVLHKAQGLHATGWRPKAALARKSCIATNMTRFATHTQEEPMNMGAYAHVSPRLQTAMLSEGRHLHDHIPYAGRGPSASTATGFGSVHAQEQVWSRPGRICLLNCSVAASSVHCSCSHGHQCAAYKYAHAMCYRLCRPSL